MTCLICEAADIVCPCLSSFCYVSDDTFYASLHKMRFLSDIHMSILFFRNVSEEGLDNWLF